MDVGTGAGIYIGNIWKSYRISDECSATQAEQDRLSIVERMTGDVFNSGLNTYYAGYRSYIVKINN